MSTRTPQPPQTGRAEPNPVPAPVRRPGLLERFGGIIRSLTRSRNSHPNLDYLMIRLVVFALAAIGLIMVFSSSMTWSIAEGSTAWGTASRQAVMVFLGFVAFWFSLKLRPGLIRRVSPWLMLITLLMLVAVLIPGIGTGREEVGSQSWLMLGPIQLQPSEIAKVTIAIWGAAYLADHTHRGGGWRNPFLIFSGVAGLFGLLIFLQGDLGMAVTFAITVVMLLIFAGVRMQWVIGTLIAGALAMSAVLMGGGFRSARFEVFFNSLFGNFEDTQGQAFQSYQGFLSLADGSLLGVGPGQSRAKWFYLPEAKNDFIFAIIGEELGLWGGALVIMLFGALGYFGIQTALKAQDQFQSLMAATLTAGVVTQAFINIGYVVGMLPVTGIQLPMISAGGTSAIITLGSMGLLASCARHEPEAVSAMQSYGRPLFDRLLFLGEPRTHDAKREAPRPAERPARFGAPVTRRPQPPVGGSVKSRNSAPAERIRTEPRARQNPPPRAARPNRQAPPVQQRRPGPDDERYRGQRGRRD
ncbi:Lipid II flippase FtsW [Corynebacterium occultum]|uniref:Probable peptidoglycan glycosyltransferase FtsW n=1 Tax=Corynebacterium occultum TaxID=2675219 RepID=A0A6B8W7A7_9CORY|nr:putative peptidoglycan glycosyltransferase FtsW [Corynebacterium occultum]QGU07807.1 Lipid II flippase FtsW [Corynebacterium occultum]